MKHRIFSESIVCAVIIFLLCSCNKFLEVTPTTTTINPTTIRDFQEMLNSDSLGATRSLLLDIMSDDVLIDTTQLIVTANSYFNSYLWTQSIWNPTEADPLYNSSYTRILQMNIILDRLDAAVIDANNTIENRSNVRSEALIQRAWFYLQLVNAYGPAYDPNTAASDLGVPLILVPDAFGQSARATVEAVYAQIISDLTQAVTNPYLQAMGSNIIHPGKAAAFALLARTYLYRGEYTQAEVYADSTLALASQLTNYNLTTYINPRILTDLVGNPEVLMAKVSLDPGFYNYFSNNARLSGSLELRDSLTRVGNSTATSNDLRYSKKLVSGGVQTSGTLISTDNSVAVPEVMLIKAECLARRGVSAEAGALVDLIRQNRRPASALPRRTYTTNNTLMYVLSERRRELFLRGGLRLFDLKRLNKEAQWTRQLQRTDQPSVALTRPRPIQILATLPPGSNRYLLPFSNLVTAANPLIVQNPRDN